MSDPVTNIEIEDVLSSIRRLVSEDSRAKPEQATTAKQDRLVLTPALRVKQDVEEKQPTPEPSGGVDDAFGAGGPVLDETRGAHGDLGAAIPDTHFEGGADAPVAKASFDKPVDTRDITSVLGTDPLTLEMADRLDGSPVEQARDPGATDDAGAVDRVDAENADDGVSLAETDPADPVEEGVAEDIPNAEITPTSALARLVEDEIARALSEQREVLDQVDDTPDDTAAAAEDDDIETGHDDTELDERDAFAVAEDFTPIFAPRSAASDDARFIEQSAAIKEAAAESLRTEAIDEAQVVAPADTEETTEKPEPEPQEPGSSLETKIAALEQMVAQKAEDYDAEEDGAADASSAAAFIHRPPERLEWRDRVRTEAPDERMPARDTAAKSLSKPKPEKPAPTWFAEDAGMIDEEMLRDMVSEIIRHELQGALGERITRNVRKLVRREIHRVLMSQEFD